MTSTVQAIEPAEFPWFDYSRYTFSLGLHDAGRAWLSGHSASEYDRGERRIVVNGGMAEQARTAYAKVATILAAADLGPGDVVRIVENLTAAGRAHYAEAAKVRRERFGDRPAVCVTSVDSLLRPAALLEVEVVAARGATVHRHDDGSASVEYDGVIHLSGIEGDPMHGATKAQVDGALERLGKRLGDLGLAAGDVAHVELGLPAAASRDDAVAQLRSTFGAEMPALVVRRPETLRADGQLVAVTATASRGAVQRSGVAASGAPAVVRSGAHVWLSGATSLVDRALPGGILEQCEVLYDAVGATLASVGGSPEHLLKTIEYVRPDGLADYRGVAHVRERLLAVPYPASTGAICSATDRADGLLEVAATARLP